MKKTDIGVVAFIYAVCALFLVMTLRLPAAAQTYPLFIIILLAALTNIFNGTVIPRITREIEALFG